MDFALTGEQSAIFDMARAFADEQIAPGAAAMGRRRRRPCRVDVHPQEAAELGTGRQFTSAEEHGGSDLTRLDATLIFEALSYGLSGRGVVPVDPQHGAPG
jgi:alkylation response protein AidB-like acyl-CoA dehydrogenase